MWSTLLKAAVAIKAWRRGKDDLMACPTCGGATRVHDDYLMCDSCRRIAGIRMNGQNYASR
jgi:hypothetical protein